MYTISPRQGECYFLRLLLNVVKGPKSYDDLKTVNGEVCATFREACQKQGLLEDDQHMQLAMEEPCATQSPKLLRDLLAIILVSCNPSQPGHLAGNVSDAGCQVLIELVCYICCGRKLWSIHTIVIGPAVVLRRRVRRHAEPLLPGSTIFNKVFFTVKPAPCSLS
ncbi:hypothetical protein ACOMHN_037760 [Nucella lapillus]